ncbi:tRNA (N(6)-L-threonylcarbamoyladenosine(37)-C(2))-methylthiotransferase MtaB [Lagierella sp.]|uniref:tRNA (N(6)-L-threonylcarbamoyladenosine(37)-C(2))- methylthiotransferase MtaB n=1 Tax=Lagierella sp. TaxID=2849657 RepID=UPI002611FCB4|nr:tRNA (N(6)-L-threonylcarbamoyladenosine(37)-C(2))-methylthiotransferase MtaB [Lagierella sp.]
MKKVSFLTLGCKVNQYETEAMMELFSNRNYEVVSQGDKSDVFVINTCTVTNLSDRKSRQAISKVKKLNPKAIIAMVGCYVQVKPEEVADIEGVNVVLGTNNKSQIVDACEKAMEEKILVNRVDDIKNDKDFEDLNISNQSEMTRAYIKIQEGCNQYCSYCIIPFARGPVRSRELKSIKEEALRLVNSGYKEIVLTGIHVASYGKDFKSHLSLVDVIEEISKIKNLQRIRLSSVEPRLITEEFLQRVKATNKFCDHFHLSLQNGSNKILQAMNRKYSVEEYENKVKLIKDYFPTAGITTDIIVGFPGETDEDFAQTVDFVRKIGFSKVHIFKYSPREGTVAARMKNQVPGTIKKERSNKLFEVCEEVSNAEKMNQLGKTFEVLFESKSDHPGFVAGYATNYTRVNVPETQDLINHIEKVEFKNVQNGEVFGIIV